VSSRKRVDPTVYVLLIAAAVAAATAAVPGAWRIVTIGAAIVLAGIGVRLAVLRAQRSSRQEQ
jgi:hypothetical protein